MKLIRRNYCSEDFNRIRCFLSDTLILHDYIQRSWHVARWDYWRWHALENITHAKLEDVVRIWETRDGKIVAVLHPEGSGEAFFEVLPEYLSSSLVNEMIIEAEKTLSEKIKNGKKSLTIWTMNEDAIREPLLKANGYVKGDYAEYMRWRDFSDPLPGIKIADGYTIRSLGDDSELPARSWASWKAFHPDEPDSAYQGWEWYRNVQKADGYRRDLDIVTASEEGEIAGFCTVWFDPITKTGMFEPVGVVPHHKQRGIGKAMMCEGLYRLKNIGAYRAYVGSYGPIAHALYESAGFTNFDLSVPWKKEF